MMVPSPAHPLFRPFVIPAPVRAVFRRRSKEKVSDWARKNIFLPAEVTDQEGYWRPDSTPYAPAIMDTWQLAYVREVAFCAGPQCGKTLTSFLPEWWAIANRPGPIFDVMPDMDGAKKMIRDYQEPVLRASRALRKLLSPNPDDLATGRVKFRNGVRQYAAWVTSATKVKSFPAVYCRADEVEDWYQQDETLDDPRALLRIRVRRNPYTSKIFYVSSPGEYARGMWPVLTGCELVHVYLAKCPACGIAQRMVWTEGLDLPPAQRRVRWPDVPESEEILSGRLARYHCAACDAPWDDRMRDEAVREGAGAFQPVDKRYLTPEGWYDPFPKPPEKIPARPVSVGFHVPALCSPKVSLSEAAARFVEAAREPDPVERRKKLKTWTNNYPAIPWVEERKPPVAVSTLLRLRDERPEGVVPAEALLLVATADVQGDGIWYEIRAWGAHRTSWGVKYGFLPRSLADALPAQNDPGNPLPQPGSDFGALKAQVETDYESDNGVDVLPVWFGLVDARYRTNEAYRFCAELCRRLSPAMGYETRPTPLAYKTLDVYPGTHKALPGATRRVDVHTNFWKDELASRLALEPGAVGSWNLHAQTDEGYARQLSAETKDEATGHWVQRGRQPNHLWDCAVLQLVAVKILEDQGVFRRLAEARGAAPAKATPPSAPPAAAAPKKGRLW